MTTETVKELAIGINSVVIATSEPLQRQIQILKTKIATIQKQYSKDIMHLCENKPPELYNGYNACLSCKMRETCRLLYKAK